MHAQCGLRWPVKVCWAVWLRPRRQSIILWSKPSSHTWGAASSCRPRVYLALQQIFCWADTILSPRTRHKALRPRTDLLLETTGPRVTWAIVSETRTRARLQAGSLPASPPNRNSPPLSPAIPFDIFLLFFLCESPFDFFHRRRSANAVPGLTSEHWQAAKL